MKTILKKLDSKLSSHRVANILDKSIIKVLIGFIIALPATILTLAYFGVMIYAIAHSFAEFFTMRDTSSLGIGIGLGVLLLIFWCIMPVVGLLGIAGIWTRLLKRNEQLNEKLREKTRLFLSVGVFTAIFYTVIFFGFSLLSNGSLIEAFLTTIVFIIPALLGVILIIGTPVINPEKEAVKDDNFINGN